LSPRASLLFCLVFCTLFLLPVSIRAGDDAPLACLDRLSTVDSLVVAAPGGQILYQKNPDREQVPASTLKLLTALTALDHWGPSRRFVTDFYVDGRGGLKIKGYGDPLLISEVLKEISQTLSGNLKGIHTLVVDNTYFSQKIEIPGRTRSTNPYDAPVGALCANFNTVFYDRDKKGRPTSLEPQTPMIPFATDRISRLTHTAGRYTFSHHPDDGALYAGALLRFFLHEAGQVQIRTVALGRVTAEDRLILRYESRFTLEAVIQKMMAFSNNFIANQLVLALGASRYGPPATLEKAQAALRDFCTRTPGLQTVHVVEGSGISRENRLTAMSMLVILDLFKPYLRLLKETDGIPMKTGTLTGISARAGYIPADRGEPFPFALFLSGSRADPDQTVRCIRDAVGAAQKKGG
jgi:D-alanyl-D-alanine carboxypeptidase/D-alanyl-D-alanine-endopeptidase (penicillin-binding protein 4)